VQICWKIMLIYSHTASTLFHEVQQTNNWSLTIATEGGEQTDPVQLSDSGHCTEQ